LDPFGLWKSIPRADVDYQQTLRTEWDGRDAVNAENKKGAEKLSAPASK